MIVVSVFAKIMYGKHSEIKEDTLSQKEIDSILDDDEYSGTEVLRQSNDD